MTKATWKKSSFSSDVRRRYILVIPGTSLRLYIQQRTLNSGDRWRASEFGRWYWGLRGLKDIELGAVDQPSSAMLEAVQDTALVHFLAWGREIVHAAHALMGEGSDSFDAKEVDQLMKEDRAALMRMARRSLEEAFATVRGWKTHGR